MIAELEIQAYRSWVRLGCSVEERAFPQEVELSLGITFRELPGGMKSDRLEQTLCYAEICQDMDAVCRKGEYALVERLADELIERIRARTGRQAGLDLRVHKLRPPIEGLRGGVVFRLREDAAR